MEITFIMDQYRQMPNFDTDESDCSSSENGSTIHEFYLSDNDNFDDESDDNVDNDAHGGVFDDFSDFDGVVHAYVGVDAVLLIFLQVE